MSVFDLPFGKNTRVETFGYLGYTNNPNFDTLLAKIITYSPVNNFPKAVQKLYRTLSECRIEGIGMNLGLLQNILQQSAIAKNKFYTQFIAHNLSDLIPTKTTEHQQFHFPINDGQAQTKIVATTVPVSYTHLTLPTICSV